MIPAKPSNPARIATIKKIRAQRSMIPPRQKVQERRRPWNPESSGFPPPYPRKSCSTTWGTIRAYPQTHKTPWVIPCRFAYFYQYDGRRNRRGVAVHIDTLSLTQTLRAQDRDDALYHAKSSISDGRGGIVGFRFRELGPICAEGREKNCGLRR